jgi:hypothetical protein
VRELRTPRIRRCSPWFAVSLALRHTALLRTLATSVCARRASTPQSWSRIFPPELAAGRQSTVEKPDERSQQRQLPIPASSAAAASAVGCQARRTGWTRPATMTVAELEALGLRPRSTLAVIRAKCLDCCAGNKAEVRRCAMIDCPAWAYRMGSNPFRHRRLTPEQRAEQARRLRDAVKRTANRQDKGRGD